MTEKTVFTIQDICAILPHRPPFLFVDKVTKLVPDKSIIAERKISPDEFFFKGHFPQKPIMPGVLITDALAQTSGLLWGLSKKKQPGTHSEDPELFYLAAADMKFVSPAFPGDILRLLSSFEQNFGALFRYAVEASVGRKLIAVGVLTLAMVDINV
jgi:3-hydroxymyristoyl/3-hydroxydecanoyl-(acyl carrier protein) dehydratases